VIQAIQELGLKIPQDISVVSFGELDTQEIILPKITCIKQDIHRIAINTREDLIQLAEGNPEEAVHNSILPGTLQIGRSVLNLNEPKC
jgi:LacI family transcriptional regulator